jgi:UPF0755 protein
MNFNQKIIYVCFFIITLILGSGAWYYKKTHTRQYAPIPPRPEVTLTIIPGWNLRQVADYLMKQGFASSTDDVYLYTGKPAEPLGPNAAFETVNLEGNLAPETYRVFKDATLQDIINKFSDQRNKEFNSLDMSGLETYKVFKNVSLGELVKKLSEQRNKELGIKSPGAGYDRNIILTMASLVEKEARTEQDRKMVADILWRRAHNRWALQLDSSVHYAVDRSGDVFTTDKERDVDSPWNTYKYPGLPPTPIANPGLKSINAVINPEKNDYWYFLSGKDGKMYYARTLDEHNLNKRKL